MRDKLHNIYEGKSETSLHSVQQKWFALKENPSDSMADNISKIEDLYHTLRLLNYQVSESMLITKILMTLPESFNHFQSARTQVPQN